MNTPHLLQQRLQSLKHNATSGASELAREALLILRLAAEVAGEGDLSATLLQDMAHQMVSYRSEMAAVVNAMRWFLQTPAPRDKGEALSLCDILLERLDNASVVAAQTAAGLIPQSSVVLTCSYSSGVVRALRYAKDRGTEFSVLALESRLGRHAYGAQAREALSKTQVLVEIVPDQGLPNLSSKFDLVLVGADRVLRDGSIINGWPTLSVAQAIVDVAPLYSVAETFKFDNHPVVRPGFDLIPSHLITAIATEEGLLKPEEARLHGAFKS